MLVQDNRLALFADLKSRCPEPLAFDNALADVTALVNHLIGEDRFDEVFKGKWYADILFSLCDSCQILSSKCRNAGKNGIWIGIRASFILTDFDYRYYQMQIKQCIVRR